jgi:hypothetical protein
MDMIGHQDPRPDFDIRGAAGLGQQIAIERVIGLAEKCLRAPIAALGHVVRDAGNNESREASHV